MTQFSFSNDLKKLHKCFSGTALLALVNNLWAPAIVGLALAAIFLEFRLLKDLVCI